MPHKMDTRQHRQHTGITGIRPHPARSLQLWATRLLVMKLWMASRLHSSSVVGHPCRFAAFLAVMMLFSLRVLSLTDCSLLEPPPGNDAEHETFTLPACH